MEIQNFEGKMSRPFTAKEMYDLKQRNYDWQSFKYVLPKKYTHNSTSNITSGSLFCCKKNYLDDLQKQKKKIPGPSHYKDNYLSYRPKSGKMDRSKRKTMSEQVQGKSKKESFPGPGSYFKRPESANSYSSSSRLQKQKSSNQRDHYLNQVEYLSNIIPGVGAYNLSQPEHITSPKFFKKVYRKIEKKNNKQNEQNQKLLNTTECVEGTFQWIKKYRKSNKDSGFFGKSKRFVTQSKYNKRPAPNSYKMDQDWLSNKNTINITHSNNFKSVYYH